MRRYNEFLMTGRSGFPMRAVEITRPGPPDVLRIAEVDAPQPGPSEVLIRVVAAGVNRADLLQRQGNYSAPPGASPYPGLEVAGVIEACGSEVSSWKPGDEVCALLPGGGYAEFVSVDQKLALPIPPGLPLADAAAIVEASCTVWSNLRAANAAKGMSLLVHGGTGGIGSFAIQYGAALGMTVYATAGSPERAARCLQLGATRSYDYGTEDWTGSLAAMGGVDIVLDVMGAAYVERNLDAVALDGAIVIIGLQGGRRAEIDLGALLAKRARIMGTTLRSRSLADRAAIVEGVRRDVWPLIPRQVRPVVADRFPLDKAAAAHALLESGGVEGKLLLVP
jgi:NADPH2:quinone reductase